MYEKTKTIVCLAASTKDKEICIAGKEYHNDGSFGAWIRPVSSRNRGAISDPERTKNNGDFTEVLDIVTIFLNKADPQTDQPENHIIEDGHVWTHQGRLTKDDIRNTVDNISCLSQNDDSSRGGENDRIPIEQLCNVPSSLALIKPENFTIRAINIGYGIKHRAIFNFQGIPYNLSITDPLIKKQYCDIGCYPLADVLICMSLVKFKDGYAYKLVAAVIE